MTTAAQNDTSDEVARSVRTGGRARPRGEVVTAL